MEFTVTGAWLVASSSVFHGSAVQPAKKRPQVPLVFLHGAGCALLCQQMAPKCLNLREGQVVFVHFLIPPKPYGISSLPESAAAMYTVLSACGHDRGRKAADKPAAPADTGLSVS